MIEHYQGKDRDKALDWWQWLLLNNWGEIPDSLDGEELAMAPEGLQDAIRLFYAQAASEARQ